MRSRSLALGAATLLITAVLVLLLQVRVHVSGIGATCGAPFDVIAGRADWQTWYADDLTDPRLRSTTALVRTDACPAAVNRRTALAGGFGVFAVIAGATAVLLGTRDRLPPRRPKLRTLGAWVSGTGIVLTTAGLVALVLLLANPSAPLFLYVDRWVVATVGTIVLVPAIALAAGGRALMLVASTSNEHSRNSAS